MVDFNQIPSNILVPFVAVEFDGRLASAGVEVQPYKALLCGQRLSTGTIPLSAGPLTCTDPKLVTSANTAATYFGTGSIAHKMAQAWFANNQFTPCYMIGVADNGTTKQVDTITFSGPTTGSGTLALYIGGEQVVVSIASGITASAVATAAAAAVNAAFGLPVVATTATADLILTARNAGTCGKIDIRVNYYPDDVTPAGLGYSIAQTTAGATDPALTDILTVIGDTWFNVLAFGWLNDTLFSALDTELESRWGPTRQIDGRAYFGKHDTHANLVSYGGAKNSKHISVLGRSGALSAPYAYSAAVAAVVAREAASNPGRPYQSLRLEGIKPPLLTDEYTFAEQNILLDAGVSTAISESGSEYLQRLITTYQKNTVGADDDAYRDVPTMDVLSLLRYSLRNRLLLRYPRAKLADDGTRVAPGSVVATPAGVRGEVLSWYREMEAAGYVENFDLFKANLIVERNATNRNRLDMLVPADLINMLIVRAAQIQFRA